MLEPLHLLPDLTDRAPLDLLVFLNVLRDAAGGLYR